jgi:hypothetical protein
LPDRSTCTAGLSGDAFFLMVLPFFDSMAISPCSLTSATVPPGLPLPQFQETIRQRVSKCYCGLSDSANMARSTRASAPAARPKHTRSFHLAHLRAGAGLGESEPKSRTFIALLDLGVSHVARPSQEDLRFKKMT